MDTFQIVNGDLALSGGGLATVTGRDKIAQDLAVSLLTPFGSDRFHPRFGSVLLGMIGRPSTSSSSSMVQAEIQRVISNYMAVQSNQSGRVTANGLPTPYSQSDLVGSIDSIKATPAYDAVAVSISLTTVAGEQLTLAANVSDSTSTVRTV